MVRKKYYHTDEFVELLCFTLGEVLSTFKNRIEGQNYEDGG